MDNNNTDNIGIISVEHLMLGLWRTTCGLLCFWRFHCGSLTPVVCLDWRCGLQMLPLSPKITHCLINVIGFPISVTSKSKIFPNRYFCFSHWHQILRHCLGGYFSLLLSRDQWNLFPAALSVTLLLLLLLYRTFSKCSNVIFYFLNLAWAHDRRKIY